MAENELDPAVIKRTQDTLGKYIKKPPLTEKLLKKPPFRFLHDVFKVVIKETGYFDGLYSADELNFENIKDRDDKMRFLQKMIEAVKLTTQRDLHVKTSKIVAGHETERTNELLQMIGEIIEQQLNWKDAVKVIANGNDIVNRVDKDKEKEKVVTAKKKETKGEKSKETIKNKSKSKESKPGRENKNSKNATPSPDEKIQKITKAAPTTKTKEKSLNRQATIEKVIKEPKEKEKVGKKSKDFADKTKVLKTTKDESKRTSPSSVNPSTPIQSETNVNVKNTNGKVRQKSIESEITNRDIKETKKASNEALPKQNSKESLNDDAMNDVLQRSNKNINEEELKTSIDTNEHLTNGEIHATDLNGSRKSSANDERKTNSSDKKRHSSAKKSHSPKELNNINNAIQEMSTTEPMNLLKTVNENGTKIELSEKESKNQQQQSPKTVKREPTFTHENSRDSVGSNSNSSMTRPRTSLRPPSARPPSARPGAPRRRDKNVEIILQPNEQIKISNINVKLETFGGDLDDDGENLVIIENATSVSNLDEENKKNELEAVQLEQQGHLVQQILETQKELTQQNGEIGLKGDKDNLETAYDANVRQSSARQMNNLRDIILTLTKSISPFGKLMDFIPEDIDAMQLELNMWRDTYSQAASDLKREKSLTESATEPMKNQLIGIEANIQEYLEMIDASRVKIQQNYDKIVKMLLEQ